MAFNASWAAVATLSSGSGTLQQNSGVAQANAGFKAAGDIVDWGKLHIHGQSICANHICRSGRWECHWRHGPNEHFGQRLRAAHERIFIVGVTAGAQTFLAGGCGTATASTVMRLTVSGTTLTASYNGSHSESCVTTTDSTYASGSPGLYINNGSGATAAATQASTFSAN